MIKFILLEKSPKSIVKKLSFKKKLTKAKINGEISQETTF
jgi:hypothetical protein